MPEENKIKNQAPNLDKEEKGVIKTEIEEEMKQSYLDYAMSVIVSRALPDIRDGLKPVHRRILFAMNEMGMHFNKPTKKSARIVGEVLGKYHPHGDVAVYDSMVRMAQDWSLRYPLIQGQGNFGSIDGDSPAAMRYTEAKLAKIAEELLVDIDKDTVDFTDNFDSSLKEPTVLPAKLPNLLINGSSGIAVGMATNIPPHNLSEVVDATVYLIENPNADDESLMNFVKAPDFPTGGIIQGVLGLRSAYKTGRGRVVVKAVAKTEEKSGKKRIIVTEIPYMVNKSQLVEQIADLIKDKQIDGISDLRDESSMAGIRIVIELKKDANEKIILNRLFKYSRLQVAIGINLLSLVDAQPKTLNLKQIIHQYIRHRQIVVTRRTQFELDKAEDRAHILEGLIVALNSIDDVISRIKASKNTEEAKKTLINNFNITEIQAQAILDMRLQRLSSLEQEKIKTERDNLIRAISEFKEILSSDKKILGIIKDELLEIKKNYGDERKTKIEQQEVETDIGIEELIQEEDMVVSISHTGYIKRISVDSYKQQQRGGKGVIAQKTEDEDFVEDIFIANTHSYLLFFTNKGKVYWLKVYEIPETSRQAKGKAVVNLINLDKDEKISATIVVRDFTKGFLFLVTSKGIVKKTTLENFSNPRKGGIKAISLEDELLVSALLTNGEQEILIASKKGMAVRFSEQKVRPMGRSSRGVKGIDLADNDEVVGSVIVTEKEKLLTATENGYGKRTSYSDYRITNRGGKGVRNIICSDRNGEVVEIKSVNDSDDIMLISKNGILIRINVKEISIIGRNTQGMRLMKLSPEDKVVAAAKIAGD